MIFDFNSSEQQINPSVVGGKFFYLYNLNKIDQLEVPAAFCITDKNFNPDEVLSRCDFLKKYAVRSSSSQEDRSGQTAAGIFESYLNIDSEEELLKYIQICFKAVNSPKVTSYFKKSEAGKGTPVMAVIVQEMVLSEISGVLFTKNPVNGADEYFIESVDGLGDKLVSGNTNATTRIIRKDELPDDNPYKELKDAAQLIETRFKNTMDIEWAWADNKLFILQARPIKNAKERIYPHEFWTRANIGEIIPKPLTPLSWDVFKEVIFKSYRIKYYSLVDRFFTNIVHLIPRTPPEKPSPEEKDGYLYLNLDTILKSFGGEPWVNRDILELGLGFHIPDKTTVPPKGFTDKIVSFIKGSIFLIELALPFLSMEKRLNRFIKSHIRKANIGGGDPDRIFYIARFLFGWHIAITARCFTHLGFIKKITKIINGEPLSNQKLITLLSNFNNGTLFLEPKVKNRILDELKNRTIHKQRGSSFKTPAEGKELVQFINKYGHRSVNEFELSQPGWAEDVPGLIEFLEKTGSQKRKQLPEIHYSFWEKMIVPRMEGAIMLREDLKSLLIKQYREFRYYFSDKAVDLIGKKIISNVDDIFYLKLDEVEEATTEPDIKKHIKNRKQYHNEAMQKQAPFYLTDHEQTGANTHRENGFNGIGCSGGIAEGVVRLLTDIPENLDRYDDFIIITKSADPGWTPVILKSKGMITEIGGVLSHIATIAREFSIPMIVGAEGVMDKFHDGQLLKMNGSTGEITIIEMV